jgi:predicted dehydrogenase
VAVIGLGYWGVHLVRNMHELDDVEVVAVCDTRPAALERTNRRYPAVTTVGSPEELFASPEIDAIVIATPIASHYELARAALEAGKHVFVEKPLADSLPRALELVELAERERLVLMPGHTFLYSPAVNAIEQLIASGELGEIYFVSTSRVNLGQHQADVSVAWDLAPHDFSILRAWLGEVPSRVSALSRGCVIPSIPDVAFINLEYQSGAIAHVELSWLAPSKLRRTTIVGSQKMIVYDDTSNEPVRLFDSGVLLKDPETFGEYQLTYRTGAIVSPPIHAAEPLALELSDFANAVLTGSTPRSSAGVGVDVVRTIEAVDRSLALDGARVEIEPLPTDTIVPAG